MKGDFTRGIEPDRKRGKRYRRVLVQQSRVLLDSDVAALVDSVDHELRAVTQDLGCALGSPDYGYLITPGRLLALFEHKKGITSTGPGTVMRDYSRKYPAEPESRYPSLRIQTTTAKIPLVEPLVGAISTSLAIWYRADAAATISITAGTATTAVNLAQVTTWTRAEAAVAVAAGTSIADITIASTGPDPVWIGLVELDEDRATGAHFWAARGRFHAHGLTPELATATGYPELSYPAENGFAASDAVLDQLPAGTRVVAYLETWERDITAAEDPGIREVALGKVDTTVRTEVKGQVKWALAAALTPAQLRDAFGAVAAPASLLDVSAPTAAPSNDPCAMPTAGGYSGVDHRLYRFEVQAGGSPTTAVIKWARDNACHVFPVLDVSGAIATLDRASGLADGDIVEVLSEVVDLADAARATVAATGVTPATRQVGVLVRLKQEEPDTQGRDRFTLIDRLSPPNTVDPAADPARYPTTASGLVPLRLRRWDGVVTGAPDANGDIVATIEDGITITLDGTFQPGEYWQYEARRGAAGTNPPTRTPLGPERILAPLAVLTLQAPADPAVLEAWLDHRFSPICELDADDIAFDGDRVDSGADTVQEAIEELFERDTGNCCDATLDPNGRNSDDAARITAAITANSFPDGGHLCLQPGIYDLLTPIVIDREVTIRGCPEATLFGHGPDPLFRITQNGRLRIEQLVLYNGPTPTAKVLVELQPGAHLYAREVGFLAADAGAGTAALATPDAQFIAPVTNASQDPPIDPDALPPSEIAGCHVELRDCVVLAPTGVLGIRLAEMIATRSAFVFQDSLGGISADQIDYLVLRECALRGGLTANFFAQVQPELLRGQSERLVETAAALPGGGGVAITAQFVLGGALDHNCVRAKIGVWSRVARDLTMHDDVIDCPAESWGIRFHHARRVDLDGERITADVGIEVPLSAAWLSVRQCVVTSAFSGITVSGERGSLGNAGSFQYVNIEGNTVTSTTYGIEIGGGGTQATLVNGVRVGGNSILLNQARDNSSAIIAIGDGLLTSSLVIDGNAITTNQAGIRVAGSGCLLRGNDITLIGNGPGIAAYGRVGTGLISVDGNVIAGINNSFTAINLIDIMDVRVTDNQVRTIAPWDVIDNPMALAVRGLADPNARQYVVGNDFAAGSVNVMSANNLNLSANTMRFLSVDSGTTGQNGLVHDNEISAMIFLIFAISANLTGLRGIWKISDNLALGAVGISGASHTKVIRFPGVFNAAAALAGVRARLASVDRVKLAAAMAPARLDPSTPREMTDATMRRIASLPAAPTDDFAAAALDPSSVIETIHDEAAIDAIGPLVKFLGDNPVTFIPITITIIEPFDFHISGNRFMALTITPASGTPPAGSSLQVVDNKLTLVLDATTTSTSVVANNSASNIGPGIGTQVTAILTPNLET